MLSEERQERGGITFHLLLKVFDRTRLREAEVSPPARETVVGIREGRHGVEIGGHDHRR